MKSPEFPNGPSMHAVCALSLVFSLPTQPPPAPPPAASSHPCMFRACMPGAHVCHSVDKWVALMPLVMVPVCQQPPTAIAGWSVPHLCYLAHSACLLLYSLPLLCPAQWWRTPCHCCVLRSGGTHLAFPTSAGSSIPKLVNSQASSLRVLPSRLHSLVMPAAVCKPILCALW